MARPGLEPRACPCEHSTTELPSHPVISPTILHLKSTPVTITFLLLRNRGTPENAYITYFQSGNRETPEKRTSHIFNREIGKHQKTRTSHISNREIGKHQKTRTLHWTCVPKSGPTKNVTLVVVLI